MTPRAAYLHIVDGLDLTDTPANVNADAILDSCITVAQTAVELAANKRHPDRHTRLYDAHAQAVARLRQLIRLTEQVETAQRAMPLTDRLTARGAQ